MFEQSILINHSEGRKTGALAASLSVQTLGMAVFIALPLIYNERLPDIHPFISLTLPVAPPPPLPVQERTVASSSNSMGSAAPLRIFVPRITDLSATPEVGLIEAPPSFAGGVEGGVPGGTGVGTGMIGQLFRTASPVAKPRVAEPVAPAKPTIVGGDVQAAKLLKRVMPVYPALARQVRVSGTVRLIGIIAKDGTIQQLQVASGHPLLIPAAVEAVRQWIYTPTLLNGQAVEVIAPIDVIFTLSQ